MRPVPRACPAQRGALRGVPHGLVVVPDGEVRRAVFLDDQVIHAWCLVSERDVLHITMSNAVIFLLFSSLQVWQFLFPPRRSTFSVDLGFLLFNAVTLTVHSLPRAPRPSLVRAIGHSYRPSFLGGADTTSILHHAQPGGEERFEYLCDRFVHLAGQRKRVDCLSKICLLLTRIG